MSVSTLIGGLVLLSLLMFNVQMLWRFRAGLGAALRGHALQGQTICHRQADDPTDRDPVVMPFPRRNFRPAFAPPVRLAA